jgi:AcrR family transcriptional regulator
MSNSSPQRQVRDPIEQRILDAAEDAMLSRGAPDLRVGDVVDATETSVGTIYTLFGSKAGLIAAVVEDLQREIAEYALAPIDHDRTPRWDDLIDLCVRYELIVRRDFRRLLLVGRFLADDGETDEHSADVRQRLLHQLGSAFLLTSSFIKQLVELGEIRPVDHLSITGWLYSTLSGTAMSVSHMPPVLGDTSVLTSAIFRTQREMLAQALLPVDRLDDQGRAPRELWIGSAAQQSP